MPLIDAKGGQGAFLPSYSPEINPIEETWFKVKALLRKMAARTVEALHAAIDEAIASITASDAQGGLRHRGDSAAQPA
jgi:transposase